MKKIILSTVLALLIAAFVWIPRASAALGDLLVNNANSDISANYEFQDDHTLAFGDSAEFLLEYDEDGDDDFRIYSDAAGDTEMTFENEGAGVMNLTIDGKLTAGSIDTGGAAAPALIWRDTDAGGAASTDEHCLTVEGGFSTTTEDEEISDFAITAWGAATAGTQYTHLFWDGSDSHLYMGVLADYTGANPSVAPLDVADYESLVWDFDFAEDKIGVSSPVSGTTAIDFGTINLETDALDLSGGSITNMAVGGLPDNTVDIGCMGDDAISVAELATDGVTMDAVDADGAFTSLTGAWATTGLLSGGVVTKVAAAPYTIGTTNAAEAYGGVIHVTGAHEITLPAVVAGMSFTVITIGDNAVVLDPDAGGTEDRICLDGTDGGEGKNVTNTSGTGDCIVCTYYKADYWYCISGSNDGDPWTMEE